MITSKMQNTDHAFVWIWLPGKTDPIVAGRITKINQLHVFTYGKSYLENPEAIRLKAIGVIFVKRQIYP